MALHTLERRLSTILVADAEGYTRWMSADEEGTLRALTLARSIIVTAIGEFSGRVFGGAGDSVLAEFASPLDAVRGAVAMQSRLAERPIEAWAGPRLAFRIGIHLGDVVVADADLLGDTVNVASRIEASADAGGICVSAAVLDQIEGRLPYLFEPMGDRQFKNLDRSIRTYRLILVRERRSGESADSGPRVELPTIALMPFDNLGVAGELAYLGAGIAEDIVANLARFRELHVTAWSSSLAYKGRRVAPEQIGRELRVRYVLAGTVRVEEGTARVTARLIATADGSQVWAERYDRALDDVFDVQEDVARQIVTTLVAHVNEVELRRIRAAGTDNLEAWGLLAEANEALYRFDPESNAHAVTLLRRAVELDPMFARAWAALSVGSNLDWTYGWGEDPEHALERGESFARRAIENDPSNARGHAALGYVHITASRGALAIAAYERALTLNPNDADILAEYGLALGYVDRSEEAEAVLRKAIGLNPLAPDWYLWFLGNVLFSLGRCEEVIAVLGRMRDPTQGNRLLAACHGLLGHVEIARAYGREVLAAQPDFSIEAWNKRLPRDPRQGVTDRYVKGLRLAGLPP